MRVLLLFFRTWWNAVTGFSWQAAGRKRCGEKKKEMGFFGGGLGWMGWDSDGGSYGATEHHGVELWGWAQKDGEGWARRETWTV